MGDFIVHRARFFEYQPKAIQSMSFDDIDKKIAISRSDNTIEIWCAKNEYLESVIVPASDRQVEVVLFCRSQLLSAGLDGFIVLYDLARLCAKKLVPSIGGAIWCMTRNKSETKIAVGTEDGYVVVYEIQIDDVIFEKSFNKQDTRILSIAWHRDEDVLVTGGIDNIRVWNANSGQVLQRISVGRAEKNKETLVWCLAITSDFNIISGDSRGKVSVWNSELGTLIKAFQTHAVDVLCLCMDESEKKIYCSGIDPSIVQLEYVTVNETDKYKSWIKGQVFYHHTHDVRSILIANKQLISAGVDTKIVFKNVKEKQSHSIKKYNSMPQKQMISTFEDYVLMQNDYYLELWKMGQTTDDINNMIDGENMAIFRSPKKYLHLKSKGDLHIVCSSIGGQPSSTGAQIIWLSYSDVNVIHIYQIEISSKQVLEPSVKITKIKSLPLACGNRPAILMNFYNHSANNSLRLCYLTNKSCLQTLKLVKDQSGFMLESTIQCIQQENLTDNRVYMIVCKEDYVATVDTDLNVLIWNLKDQKLLCTLPRYESLATCMCFHPEKNYLLVCYANRKIVEYDFDINEYTDWSRKTSDNYPKQWHKQHHKLLRCFYDRTDAEKIITYDEQYFVVINKKENMPVNPHLKIFQQKLPLLESIDIKKSESEAQLSDDKSALHISNKYKYIMYADEFSKGQLLIVELTPLSVTERLPPSLKQKKFGT